jgi:hypothetical protein
MRVIARGRGRKRTCLKSRSRLETEMRGGGWIFVLLFGVGEDAEALLDGR